MRHAMLLCGHAEITSARESMFDAADAVVAPALEGRPIPPPPIAPKQYGDRHQIIGTHGLIPPADPFRAPLWTTVDGRPSDTRWPYLTALNWLLPMSAEGEAPIARGDMLEDYWNSGYRALIPNRLGKALTPEPGRETDQLIQNADRQVLRHLERQRRKALTHAIRPEWTQEDNLRLDVFEAPFSSCDSQEHRQREPIQPTHIIRAVDRQAACLRPAHIIVGHAAWIRALYRRFLLEQSPRADWDPDYQVYSADSEGSGHDDTPTRENASQTACGGARCLERAAAGLPRPSGRSGPTGPRCHRCRAAELEDNLTQAIRELLNSDTYHALTTRLQGTRHPSHIEIGALLIADGHAPTSVFRICKALAQLGVAHSEDLEPRDPTTQPRTSRLPPGACKACRGKHRRHTDDHRCLRVANTATQEPIRREDMQPRRYGPPSRPRLEDAEPHFRPCTVAARTPEAATTNARQAMQQLTTSATPYPAAGAPPPAHPDTRERTSQASNAPPTRDAPPPTITPPHNTDITASAGTTSPSPTIAEQLRATLAAFFRTRPQGQNDTHAAASGRNRASPTTDTTTALLPPPRPLGLPTRLPRDFPNLAEAMAHLGGTIMECGATPVSPAGNVAHSQCFYLALAASVTAPSENHAAVTAEIREQIEGAVRAARPQWEAEDVIG